MKGDFLWALQQMKKGKKVRRAQWIDSAYRVIEGNRVIKRWSDMPNYFEYTKGFIYDYEGVDWELFKEVKE